MMKRVWHRHRWGDGLWSDWYLTIDDKLAAEELDKWKDRIVGIPRNVYIYRGPTHSMVDYEHSWLAKYFGEFDD